MCVTGSGLQAPLIQVLSNCASNCHIKLNICLSVCRDFHVCHWQWPVGTAYPGQTQGVNFSVLDLISNFTASRTVKRSLSNGIQHTLLDEQTHNPFLSNDVDFPTDDTTSDTEEHFGHYTEDEIFDESSDESFNGYSREPVDDDENEESLTESDLYLDEDVDWSMRFARQTSSSGNGTNNTSNTNTFDYDEGGEDLDFDNTSLILAAQRAEGI